MAATRVAAMVAAAIFFSTFYSASTQAPAPSAMGEAPAPSALAGCSDILLNLSGCLTYVEEGSNLTKPDKECCPALAGLVESNPICLCVLLEPNATQSYGITLDSKKTLKLPSVCGVQTPPATACSAFGVPVPGPIGAPTGSEGPHSSISPEGAAGAPTPGNSDSEASSIVGFGLPITVGLVIAFLPTFF